MFVEFILQERKRQVGAIDWHVNRFQDKGHRADVVFMPVCQNDCGNLVTIIINDGEVRNENVYARKILIGECHPGIQNDGLLAVADHHHVHSEMPDAAERYDFYFTFCHIRIEWLPFCGLPYSVCKSCRSKKESITTCPCRYETISTTQIRRHRVRRTLRLKVSRLAARRRSLPSL